MQSLLLKPGGGASGQGCYDTPPSPFKGPDDHSPSVSTGGGGCCHDRHGNTLRIPERGTCRHLYRVYSSNKACLVAIVQNQIEVLLCSSIP